MANKNQVLSRHIYNQKSINKMDKKIKKYMEFKC